MIKGNQKISFVVLWHDGDKQYLKGLMESLPKNCELILVKTAEGEPRVKFFGSKIVNDVLVCEYEINYKELDLGHFRNVAKSYASCEWIISLDADERISISQADIDLINKQPENVGGILVNLISYTVNEAKGVINTIQPVRIFRNKFNWKYLIHEQILESITKGGYMVRPSDIMIRHVGYAKPEIQAQKLKRNLPLLCKQILEEPTDYMEYKLWQTTNALMQLNNYYKERHDNIN
jgi:hypothetical protein